MRLDKYLSDMSIGTRKEVKEIVKKGRVKVNDIIIKKSDMKITESDIIKVDDEIIDYIKYEYYLLNKPSGYLSATFDNKERVVMELIDGIRKDLVIVGRLDKDTEGALLITNDGTLAHHLISPKYHVTKKYYVEVDGMIPDNAKEVFDKGIQFDEFKSEPVDGYEKLSDNTAYLTISEGKYHQVKRMFGHFGLNVTYLNRVNFAFLDLEGLKTGEYRHLDEDEINKLYEIVNLERK